MVRMLSVFCFFAGVVGTCGSRVIPSAPKPMPPRPRWELTSHGERRGRPIAARARRPGSKPALGDTPAIPSHVGTQQWPERRLREANDVEPILGGDKSASRLATANAWTTAARREGIAMSSTAVQERPRHRSLDGFSAVAILAVAVGAVGAYCRQAAGLKRAGGRAEAVVLHATGDSSASALEAEAAKLRAEVESMERTAAAERRLSRAKELLGEDGSISLGAAELRARLKKVADLDASTEEVAKLMAACKDFQSNASLTIDALASVEFDDAFEELSATTIRQARAAKEAKEQEAAKAAEETRWKKSLTDVFSPGDDSDDRSLPVRLLACLAYVLPLLDGLDYAGPVLFLAPALEVVLSPLVPLSQLKDAIPFGTFILLFALSALARNTEFPRLLRFNLQQAVVLDIFFILPDLIQGFVAIQLPVDFLTAFSLILYGAVFYSQAFTLLGKEPDGLGAISDATKRNLGPY